MNLPVAAWALVRYHVDGPPLWHERHLLAKASTTTTVFAIETPDGDTYLENLRRSPDIAEVEFIDKQGEVVVGIPEESCYRFRHVPSPVQQAIAFGKGLALIQKYDGREPDITYVPRCSGTHKWWCIHAGSDFALGHDGGQLLPEGTAYVRPISFAVTPGGSLFKVGDSMEDAPWGSHTPSWWLYR